MLTVPKNSRATIRVGVSRCGGSDFLDVRTWTAPGDGKAKPTRKGVTIPMTAIPDFVDAVVRLGQEARRKAM